MKGKEIEIYILPGTKMSTTVIEIYHATCYEIVAINNSNFPF